jgi:muramoyltetrapeptide carboxypeptidase LdcA involved in peptidoglycan recycling
MAQRFGVHRGGVPGLSLDHGPLETRPAPEWSDDEWWPDQDGRRVETSTGWLVINSGRAEGTVQGGNQCTFNVLHGTELMPHLHSSVMFLEDDAAVKRGTSTET